MKTFQSFLIESIQTDAQTMLQKRMNQIREKLPQNHKDVDDAPVESEQMKYIKSYEKMFEKNGRPNKDFIVWVQKTMPLGSDGYQEAKGGFRTSLGHFYSMSMIPGIGQYVFGSKGWDMVRKDLQKLEKEYHEKMQSNRSMIDVKKAYTKTETEERYDGANDEYYDEEYTSYHPPRKIVEVGGGLAWYDLERSACEHEGEALGHCGNSYHSGEDQTIFSLRKSHVVGDKEYHEPFLTFIFDNRTWKITEQKGKQNEKPQKKYSDQILKLLLVKGLVRGFDTSDGYKPEANWKLHDFTSEQLVTLVAAKPQMLDYLNAENAGLFRYRLVEGKLVQVLGEDDSLEYDDVVNYVSDNERLELAYDSDDAEEVVVRCRELLSKVNQSDYPKLLNSLAYVTPLAIPLFDKPLPKHYIESLINQPQYLGQIKNPSEKMIDTALNGDGRVIRFVSKPTMAQVMLQTKQRADAIKYIDQSVVGQDVMAEIVSETPLALEYIDPQTSELQMIGIKNCPQYRELSLARALKNPSDDVIKAMVKKDPDTIMAFRNSSDEIKRYAIAESNSPDTISNIKNPSEELMLWAVKYHPTQIQYMDNPTKAVIEQTVKRSTRGVFSVPSQYQTDALLMMAAKYQPWSISDMKRLPPEVQVVGLGYANGFKELKEYIIKNRPGLGRYLEPMTEENRKAYMEKFVGDTSEI